MERAQTRNSAQENLRQISRRICATYRGEQYVIEADFIYSKTANFYQQPQRIEGVLEYGGEEFNFVINNQRLKESNLSQKAINILHHQFAIS